MHQELISKRYMISSKTKVLMAQISGYVKLTTLTVQSV